MVPPGDVARLALPNPIREPMSKLLTRPPPLTVPEGDQPLPARAALEQALAVLEAHTSHPDTGAIHDPLYELLSEREQGHVEALQRALLRHRHHPAVPQIRRLLGPAFTLPPRELEDVLTDHGAWTHDDPVAEVEHRLRSAAQVRAVLEERLAHQLDETDRQARTANALALVGALLTILALAGWAGALGLWTIDWFEPPAPPADVAGPEVTP